MTNSLAHHPIFQTTAINNLTKNQEKLTQVLADNALQHARCTIIMENIIRRLEIVEKFEKAEHGREEK